MSPDRIDALVFALTGDASRVPVGTSYHGGGLDGAPVYDVQKEAIRLIRAWQAEHPMQPDPPTLEDVMDAFTRDYPNGHLLLRHDPLRSSNKWTATAYDWRHDGFTPTVAIERLRDVIAANTVSVLPTLSEGYRWVLAPPSTTWRPVANEHIATLKGTASRALFLGTPLPMSVILDEHRCNERLYVPVKP